jgi:GH25 family lysozyme M1 (1,4-beta-N-acetylmuramidase)
VANWEGARSNGIMPHVYHYFLGAHPPGAQLANIKHTLQLVDFSSRDSILAIDVEKDHNVGINVGICVRGNVN